MLGSRIKTPMATRVEWIDQLRGLGVLVMVVDHVIGILQPSSFLRYTVTRISLPCLMMAAGFVMARRPTSILRTGKTLWVGLIGTVVFAKIGLGIPDPMFVAGVALALTSTLQRLLPRSGALLAGVLGVTQCYAWPLPVSGYQPGTMMTLVALASLAPMQAMTPFANWRPLRFPVIRWFGTHPLLVYLAHLPLLLVLHEVVT